MSAPFIDMERADLRLECLDRAIKAWPDAPIDTLVTNAQLIESYVTGADVAAAERRLAAIGAALNRDADV